MLTVLDALVGLLFYAVIYLGLPLLVIYMVVRIIRAAWRH